MPHLWSAPSTKLSWIHGCAEQWAIPSMARSKVSCGWAFHSTHLSSPPLADCVTWDCPLTSPSSFASLATPCLEGWCVSTVQSVELGYGFIKGPPEPSQPGWLDTNSLLGWLSKFRFGLVWLGWGRWVSSESWYDSCQGTLLLSLLFLFSYVHMEYCNFCDRQLLALPEGWARHGEMRRANLVVCIVCFLCLFLLPLYTIAIKFIIFVLWDCRH
jgi:hypothetical protein